MEGNKRRKLSLKIKKDSSYVEVIPEKNLTGSTHKESKKSVGKENLVEPKTSSTWASNTDRAEHDIEINPGKSERKECSDPAPEMTDLQQKLWKLSQKFASRYSSWDLPPFPEPEELKTNSSEQSTSPAEATERDTALKFPSPCYECAKVKAAVKKCTSEIDTTQDMPKSSLKESLGQLFSVDHLNRTLDSSRTDVDLTMDTTPKKSSVEKNPRNSTDTLSKVSKPYYTETNTVVKAQSKGNRNIDRLGMEKDAVQYQEKGLRYSKKGGSSSLNRQEIYGRDSLECYNKMKGESSNSNVKESYGIEKGEDLTKVDSYPEKRDSYVTEPGESSNPARNESTKSDGSDDLQQCPLCQVTFPTGTSQLEKDGHIAQCLSMAGDDAMW